MSNQQMTLRQIFEIYGISRRAIQGYEALDLVRATGKTKHGYLLYDEAALGMILKIRQFQSFGFSVREITELLQLSDASLAEKLITQKGVLQRQKNTIETTLQNLESLIRSLQKTE